MPHVSNYNTANVNVYLGGRDCRYTAARNMSPQYIYCLIEPRLISGVIPWLIIPRIKFHKSHSRSSSSSLSSPSYCDELLPACCHTHWPHSSQHGIFVYLDIRQLAHNAWQLQCMSFISFFPVQLTDQWAQEPVHCWGVAIPTLHQFECPEWMMSSSGACGWKIYRVKCKTHWLISDILFVGIISVFIHVLNFAPPYRAKWKFSPTRATSSGLAVSLLNTVISLAWSSCLDIKSLNAFNFSCVVELMYHIQLQRGNTASLPSFPQVLAVFFQC